MALIVPPPQIEHIKKVLELPDEKIAAIVAGLKQAGPHFNIDDLSREVSGKLGLPRELVVGVIQVLGSLYLTKDGQTSPTDEFVDKEVYAALKKARMFSPEDETAEAQWRKLQKFLKSALALEDTLGTAAKAGYVLTQHERIYVSARILTDVRPIFHVDTSEKPHSAVVVHMLRVVYRDVEGEKFEHFYALDSNDVRAMKTLIDRAMKKEETLKSLMADAGVTVLAPKPFF